MYIKNISGKNFKGFKDINIDFSIPNGTPGSGLNIFVGENNSGKTSIMEAMYFIRNKSTKNTQRIGADEDSEFFIEQTFIGDLDNNISHFVQENKKQSFRECLYQDLEGNKCFTVRRSFKDENEVKKILFLKDNNYSNISGIDGVFQAFYQISNIWANTSPENESKFGSSTICGNLLSNISEKFKTNNADYDAFLASFNSMFNDESSGLQSDLNLVAEETQSILNDQFGSSTVKFKFNNPEPSILFKNIKILVNDGEETDIVEKGHGLQRAVILSLLQVYARRITKIENEGEVVLKPHFLFIDEPEMGLHPQAQKKLFEALKILSSHHQIFISTHSENFISLETITNIHKFQKIEDNIEVKSVKNFDIDIRENRGFFFHHHKLFFTKKAIFVEGADDIDNYPIFSDLNGYSSLKNNFYIMSSCSAHHKYRDLCLYFGIKPFFILDIDVISKDSQAKGGFSKEIRDKILELDISCKKKDPSNLLDINLSDEKRRLKYEIIQLLKEKNYFILNNGAYEQYFTDIGEVGEHEKKIEILSYLNNINVS